MSKRLSVLLFASLGVNIFLVGLLVGGGLKARGHTDQIDAPAVASLLQPHRLITALPDERKGELRRYLKGKAPEIRPLVRDMRESRREVFRVLQTEPLDVVALEAAFLKTEAAEQTLRSEAFGILVEILDTLPEDEKALLAASLVERGKAFRKRMHDRPGPDRGRLTGPPDAGIEDPRRNENGVGRTDKTPLEPNP
ncbi:MAG: periplasmic heavy metal sensor [Pseudomonadota bacterium]